MLAHIVQRHRLQKPTPADAIMIAARRIFFFSLD